MALTRRALGGLTIGGSSAVLLAACGGNDDGGGAQNDELVWAVSWPWEAWNQTTALGNTSSCNEATAPMNPVGGGGGNAGYDFDPEGKVFYDTNLFSGPPEIVTEEPLATKVLLKEGVKWSDGKPVRLEDFIFLWHALSGLPEHANQEKATPTNTDWGSNVESITQAEDGSIVTTYKAGYVSAEWAFIGGVYLPSHVAEENGFADWATNPETMGDAILFFNNDLSPVGLGPYKPVDSKLGEYVIYEPNEHYQGDKKPIFKKLTMKMVDGLEAIVTEMRQGTVAGSAPSDFDVEILAQLDEDPAMKYETYAGATWSHIDINMNAKFFKDIALRKAWFTLINIADITEKMFQGIPIPWKGNHFFTEESPYYVDYTSEVGYGSGDIEAARAALTTAGYTWNGDGKLVSPDGEVVTTDFLFAADNVVRKDTASLIQAYAAELGWDVTLNGVVGDELFSKIEAGEWDSCIFSWVGNPAFTSSPEQFFGSGSSSNYGKFNDPAVDALIAQVNSTLELDEAAGYANEISKAVVDAAFTLPLYSSPLSHAYNTTMVGNIQTNGQAQLGPIYNLVEWTAGGEG
ncbi:ABC transporter substrate-binding protein [Glycomyces luteolus]|uniref:ABC transporter substrate-binding protein n=1 Tax=Glycomyces luteolus TaxID=2670330 RepID=A0A9X3SRZ9_9ACTN|nr:ABC transporter substrate-binding protein [Glycomyces luteolus]MDA1360614.1 ABC transporter substrate-binding protein [Glycomyces luteolus]